MKTKLDNIKSLSLNERFEYLRENKFEIIKEKKELPKFTDSFKSICLVSLNNVKESKQDTGIVHVKVIANTANWMDSQDDVIIPGAWTKSINERKSVIPHLHDHQFSLDAKVGEVTDIYPQNMSYSMLGLDGTGSTEVLIFETDVYKSYNEKIYNQYRLGKINQHSIGLNYVQLQLAINDKNDDEHFAIWNKYYPGIINKDKALENGYFFAVKELKLIENSAVLAGANQITPTLTIEDKSDQAVNTPDPIKPDYSTLIKSISNIKI